MTRREKAEIGRILANLRDRGIDTRDREELVRQFVSAKSRFEKLRRAEEAVVGHGSQAAAARTVNVASAELRRLLLICKHHAECFRKARPPRRSQPEGTCVTLPFEPADF
jgi:hypothetical protein